MGYKNERDDRLFDSQMLSRTYKDWTDDLSLMFQPQLAERRSGDPELGKANGSKGAAGIILLSRRSCALIVSGVWQKLSSPTESDASTIISGFPSTRIVLVAIALDRKKVTVTGSRTNVTIGGYDRFLTFVFDGSYDLFIKRYVKLYVMECNNFINNDL